MLKSSTFSQVFYSQLARCIGKVYRLVPVEGLDILVRFVLYACFLSVCLSVNLSLSLNIYIV